MGKKTLVLTGIVVLFLAIGAVKIMAAGAPMPEFMGFYFLDNNKLTEQKPSQLREYKDEEDKGKMRYGVKEDAGWINVSAQVQFVLYTQDIPASKCHLVILRHEGETMVDRQMTRTKHYLWKMWIQDGKDIPVKVGEATEKKNVYMIKTEAPLAKGHYAIFFGETWRDATGKALFVFNIE